MFVSFAGWEVRMVKNCDRGLEKIRPVGGIVKSWTGHERLISQ